MNKKFRPLLKIETDLKAEALVKLFLGQIDFNMLKVKR